MQAKPIVTCHGKMELFSTVHPRLAQDLPKESAEWKRSYGRPPRNVQIEASFVPYDDDILPEETVKTLISRPYFHIYWINCDVETYKQDIKEELSNWHQALKAKNITDWLIVVNEENRLKAKLLPRSSVLDKVKSEFCSKQPERCIVLPESDHKSVSPDSKPSESWTNFLSRMRQLLLQAFTRYLGKYEDNMRALREKRNEPGWNFQQYFFVQEELAFMFEMLGLYEDAMIQYDELDALFTQFVLNHASGVPMSWLETLIKPCLSWAGLSLHKSIDWSKRDLIRDNEASFLQFRNYLFSRQCALLFLLEKPWEIVRRTLDFLHNTVQEVRSLQNPLQLPVGAVDCWVYLSGFEVLQHCATFANSTIKAHAVHTASLWDHVCRKLRCLGELCGLMPDADQPSSQQLLMVVDLTSGMGLHIADDEDEEKNKPVPSDKLREAIASKESFQKIYLEQSELAMGTFKHIGRFRSARMIGKNLADFYMKLNEPQKAENFLLDAMKSYHQEGWQILTDRARLELAQCQYRVGEHQKYVKTACQVGGSQVLDAADRDFHMEEVMKIAQENKGKPILLKASSLFQVDIRDLQDRKVNQDQTYTVDIVIVNHSLVDMYCDQVWLTLVDFVPDSVIENQRTKELKKPVCRQGSNTSLENRLVMNLPSVKTQIPNVINLRPHFEGKQSSPVSSGISCVNTHEILKRVDSAGMVKVKEAELVKDSLSYAVSIENVQLKKGDNFITFSPKAHRSGFFRPGQLGIKVKSLEFLKDLDTSLYCTVISNDTYCDIQPDQILAGIPQTVKVTMHTGSHNISTDSKVEVMTSKGFTVDTSETEGGLQGDMIKLPETPRGSSVEWVMDIFQETNVEGPVIQETKVAFDCSWLPRPLLSSVTFLHPLSVVHKIYTAKDKKYIQILIHGNSPTELIITDWRLSTSNTSSVEFIRLNKIGQTMKVNASQSGSCMWLIQSNLTEVPDLDLCFLLDYQCEESPDSTVRQVQNKFSIENIQTQLMLDYDIFGEDGAEQCQAGLLAVLKIKVIPMAGNKLSEDQELLYDIDTEQTNWALYGTSSGNFFLTEQEFSVTLKVMPLMSGFLHLPRISLYKYQGTTATEKDIWSEKADLELEAIETLDTSDEEEDEEGDEDSSKGQGASSLAALGRTQFYPGQVYDSSLGKQVRVVPASVLGDVEVSV